MPLQFSGLFLTNALRAEFTIASMETDNRNAESKAKVPEPKKDLRFGHVVSWRSEPVEENQEPPVKWTDQSGTEPLK